MQPAAATDPAEPYPFWRRNVRALYVGNLGNTLGFMISFPFLPFILRDLGVEENLETWVGYAVGGFFGVSFLLGPLWGSVADHYGKKAMVLRAGLGMALGFGLLALTPNLGLFLALFLVVGACNGYVPAGLALVAGNTPRQRMGGALSTVQSGALIGLTLGPAVGAFLIRWLPNPQYLFFASALLCSLGGLIAVVFVQERHVRPPGPFRPHLLRDLLTLVRVRNMALLWMLNAVFSAAFFGTTTLMALFALDLAAAGTGGYALETWVGLASLALTIASAVALPVWGRVLDRFEPRRVLAIGLLAGTLANLAFPLVQNLWQLVAARICLGLLGAGIQPAVMRLTKESAPPLMDGRAMALGTSMMMLGNGLAPFLAGIIAPAWGLRAFFWLNCGLLGVAFTAWTLRGLKVDSTQRL